MFQVINKLSFAVAPIFYKLLFMSLTAVLVAAVIIVIRRVLAKKISPFWQYAMWLLVLIALLVPYRPNSDIAVIENTKRIEQISFRADYDEARLASKLAANSFSENTNEAIDQSKLNELAQRETELYRKSLLFDVLVPIIWLFGLGILSTYLLVSRIYFFKNLNNIHLPDQMDRFERLLDNAKRHFKINNTIKLVLTDRIKAPAIGGVFEPTILLPSYTCQLSDESVSHIISHELGHYKRHDILLNYLLLTINVIYWFNPLLWYVFKLIRDDLEVLNDDYVIKTIGANNSKDYAKSLVEVLAYSNGIALVPRLLFMVDDKKNITRRINMIKLAEQFKKKKIIIAFVSVVIMVVIAGLLLTNRQTPHQIGIYAMAGLDKTVEDYQAFVDENQPIITEKDIVAYNAEMRMFFLSDQILQKYQQQRAALTEPPIYVKGGSLILGVDDPACFIVAVDGKVVYGGHVDRPIVVSYLPKGPYITDTDQGLRVYDSPLGRETLTIEDSALVEAFVDMNKLTDRIFDVRASASDQFYDVKQLYANRTDYVGDNSKVINIISSLAWPSGATYQSLVLHTDRQPYSIEVKLKIDDAESEAVFYQNRQIAFSERALLIFALIGNVERVDFVLNDKSDIANSCFVTKNFDFDNGQKELPIAYQTIESQFEQTATLADTYQLIERLSKFYFEYDLAEDEVTAVDRVIEDDIDYSRINRGRSAYIDEGGIVFNNTGSQQRVLTQSEIDDFVQAFTVSLPSKKPNEEVINPVCHMFSSYYEQVEDINLFDFVYYMPRHILSSQSEADVAQFEALKKVDGFIYRNVEKLEDTITPLGSIGRDQVNDVLLKFAAISLDQLAGKGSEGVLYLDQYQSFYSYASDFGVGIFRPIKGEINGAILKLYSEQAILTLEKRGDYYYIVSHVKNDN